MEQTCFRLFIDKDSFSGQQLMLILSWLLLDKLPYFPLPEQEKSRFQPVLLTDDQQSFIGIVPIINYLKRHNQQVKEQIQESEKISATWQRERANSLINESRHYYETIAFISAEFIFWPIMRKERKIAYKEAGFKNIDQTMPAENLTTIKRSVEEIKNRLRILDEFLSTQCWLNGNQIGLADFIWAPFFHRLKLAGWPQKEEGYIEIWQWYQQIEKMEIFQQIYCKENISFKSRLILSKTLQILSGKTLKI